MTNNILEIQDLSVSFATFFGEVEAVRHVSFSVGKGKTLAIVGESGCGESVTANAVMRLLPQPPALYKTGKVLFNGDDLLQKTEKEMTAIRGNKIAMVFQDPMTSLNPTMKVGAQIVEGVKRHRDITKEEGEKLAIDMLKKVSVPNPEKRVNQYPHEFSGAMRQRVMIAIAMASKPHLLIADEPTTALDVTVQAQILKLMKKLKDDIDASIIMITHDLGVVADMADDVIVMYAGEVIEEGTVDEIFAAPKHPYTVRLLAAVPQLTMDKEETLHAIEGTPPDLYKPPEGCGFYDRCSEAMRICENQKPEFIEHSEGHRCRCWKYHPSYPKAKELTHE